MNEETDPSGPGDFGIKLSEEHKIPNPRSGARCARGESFPHHEPSAGELPTVLFGSLMSRRLGGP